MSFPLRACFLPLPAVLLFMATPSQAPWRLTMATSALFRRQLPRSTFILKMLLRNSASAKAHPRLTPGMQARLFIRLWNRPGGVPAADAGFKPAETFSRISDAGREIQLEFQHDKAGAPELRNQHTAESAG